MDETYNIPEAVSNYTDMVIKPYKVQNPKIPISIQVILISKLNTLRKC